VIRKLRRGALRNRTEVGRGFVKANEDELDKEIKSIARDWRYGSRQLKLGMQWRL
jgi:hypothetical protein